ncbi:hypothetical protein SERLA73DRAFT_187515 [Serpula lacrymans var. lacrymans S7.3]|uniref:Endosomal/vacuolar adapter protein YPT35 n=2 Tax=Serpula lacrymans var. lacrymans TaxID=341189 RepID=F8Q9D3_SERL3|nr:uncharacterized protein SERLADRAFT_477160 [Serpula lacrymans var. lacrymans S7.9]EGN95188.1 hypothetical protein SERLA73DRAFT_187515 [Serpula lacrymans var. lacrymans S7.3]EGO20717.1 hypothetical protein SERLADRAFT_477160 [Serpula lacrymans var. lacrymans S7.9]
MHSPQLPAPSPLPVHPFEHSKNLLVVLPDKIDVEEESRFYDELCEERDSQSYQPTSAPPAPAPRGPPSIFSSDIWLGDNFGGSLAFTRDVKISGWTSVGDKLGGAYIVYDCVIKTKEGTTIHAHKRYSAFVELYIALRRTLPRHQQHFVPALPPKSPLSRFRPAFLDQRRRQLQYWLCSILLHPDVGSCQAVRLWVIN